MPKTEQKIPTIRAQTLEHIARHLGDLGSGPQIVDWLQGWGVPGSLIEYPNTKWRMVYSVLNHYANSTENKDREMLFKIIGEMLHPIMHNGDKQAAETVAEDFNKYLEYDNLTVGYSVDEKNYRVGKKLHPEEEGEIIDGELFVQEQEELEFLRQPENKEKISTLRKAYQVFMNIAEVFCDNPSKPSHELNDAYVKTKKLIINAVITLRLLDEKRAHKLTHYFIPFNNLFTAEREYTPDDFADITGKKLSWDYIRPQMNATYGDIDELYRKVEGSDVLSKPDVQQTLNDVSLLLSKTKEDNKKITEVKQKRSAPPQEEEKKKTESDKVLNAIEDAMVRSFNNMFTPSQDQQMPQKIEITNKELVVRNAENNTPQKGKKRESPIELSFPEPVQWDKITLKIKEGRQEVGIFYDNGHIITADYIRLGFFVGKNQQKPDRQWGFLCALATLAATDIKQATAENMRSMITQNKTLSTNNVQQVKKLFVERLQDIFKTSDDPFHDKRDYYEPKFKILPEPALRREEIWPQGGRLNENLAHEEGEEEAL